MKRLALFAVLLGGGLAILYLGLGRDELGDLVAPSIPKIELPGGGSAPDRRAMVSVEPERERVMAENLVKTFRKQITLADGTTAEVTRYILKMARGETETQRSQRPELLIYQGEIPGEEQVVVRVTGEEGSIPSSSTAGEQDAGSMRQVDLVGNVIVTFLDPQRGDDLVLRTERLSVYPEEPDDPESKLLLHCPAAVEIAKASGRLSISGASLHADLAERGMTIGGPVEVTGTDFRIPAVDALLSAGGQQHPGGPRSEREIDAAAQLEKGLLPGPVTIRSQGELAFIPDPEEEASTAASSDGALAAGRFLFTDGVSVLRGQEWIRGERLEIRVAPSESKPADLSPDGTIGDGSSLESPTQEDAPEPAHAHRRDSNKKKGQETATPPKGGKAPRRGKTSARGRNRKRGGAKKENPTEIPTTRPPESKPRDLSVISFLMSSPPGSLTTFDTAMAEGECQVIEWTRAKGWLILRGRPELRVAAEPVAGDSPTGEPAPGAKRSYRLTAKGYISVEPDAGPPAAAGGASVPPPSRTRLRLVEQAAVRDSQGRLTLESGEIEALIEETTKTGRESGSPRLHRLVARPRSSSAALSETGSPGPAATAEDLPRAKIEGASFAGHRIELFPGQTPDSPPRVEVSNLAQLELTMPDRPGASGGRLVVEPLSPDDHMTLAPSGALTIEGRSRLLMQGEDREPRVLLADHLEVPPPPKSPGEQDGNAVSRPHVGDLAPLEVKAASPTLHARGHVDLVDPQTAAHLVGETLDIPLASGSTASGVLELTGHPAKMVQDEGDPSRETNVQAPRITVEVADGALRAIHARGQATLNMPAGMMDTGFLVSAGSAPVTTPPKPVEPPGLSTSPTPAGRLALNAAEVSIYSGDDPRHGPRRLHATGGVQLTDDSSSFAAFGKEFSFDLARRSGTITGDATAGLPAEIRWTQAEASRADRLEGPRIEIEEGGRHIRVPANGRATIWVRGRPRAAMGPGQTATGATGPGQLLVVASDGEMILDEDRLIARDTVRARMNGEAAVYRLHAHDAVVFLVRDPETGRREPERFVAQGQVDLVSKRIRGLGDILVATYPWDTVTLEGRGRPCWIERQDGGLLQATEIGINTQTEAIRAQRGSLTARSR